MLEVCPGTWFERLDIDGKRLTLRSRDGADATTVDAGTLGRALRVVGGADVVVEGFTFVNGKVPDDGGDVACEGSRLELRDSVLRAGLATAGGGLSVIDCSGVAEGNTFDRDQATWSGGGAYLDGDDLAFRDNSLVSNEAGSLGGGLYSSGSADVVGNTFLDDHASGGGGAFIDASWGTVSDNTVFGNASTGDGAGIYVSGGAPAVEANTFEQNRAGDEAGGLRVKLSSATVHGNTFLRNHADFGGGAVRVSHQAVAMDGNRYEGNGSGSTGGAVLLSESGSTLRNEVFTGNSASDSGGALAIVGGWSAVLVEDCTFDANDADADGGQIQVDLVGAVTTLRRVELDGGSQTGAQRSTRCGASSWSRTRRSPTTSRASRVEGRRSWTGSAAGSPMTCSCGAETEPRR